MYGGDVGYRHKVLYLPCLTESNLEYGVRAVISVEGTLEYLGGVTFHHPTNLFLCLFSYLLLIHCLVV